MNGAAVVEMDEEYMRQKKRETRNREWMERGKDELAPQHVPVHHWLTRWGAYGSERYQQSTCNSIEKFFTKGGEVTPAATAPLPPNPTILAIDRCVRLMFLDVKKHGKSVALYYLEKRSPQTICYVMALRFEDFSTWMFDCRAMVVNRLRREGVELPS